MVIDRPEGYRSTVSPVWDRVRLRDLFQRMLVGK